MNYRLTLPDGDAFWLHAPSQAQAVEAFARIRPGVPVLRVESFDERGRCVQEAEAETGTHPDGYRDPDARLGSVDTE